MPPAATPLPPGDSYPPGALDPRLDELLDWAETLADCVMQGYVGEE